MWPGIVGKILIDFLNIFVFDDLGTNRKIIWYCIIFLCLEHCVVALQCIEGRVRRRVLAAFYFYEYVEMRIAHTHAVRVLLAGFIRNTKGLNINTSKNVLKSLSTTLLLSAFFLCVSWMNDEFSFSLSLLRKSKEKKSRNHHTSSLDTVNQGKMHFWGWVLCQMHSQFVTFRL